MKKWATGAGIQRHLRRSQAAIRAAAQFGPATQRAAPGPWRASVALPAMCWSQDTIPKPDGLAGPQRGPEPDGNRTQPGHDPGLCGIGSSRVRPLPFGGPAAGFLLEDHAGEDLLDDLLGFGIEAADGLELELEGIIGAALILGKK